MSDFSFDNFSNLNKKLKKAPRHHRDLDGWQEGFVPQDEEAPEAEVKVSPRTLLPLYIIAGLLFAILGGRLFWLQIFKGNQYFAQAEGNRIRIEVERAPRGVIYDRNKTPLVKNIPNFEVSIIPADLPKNEAEKSKILTTLSGAIGVSVEQITAPLLKVGPYSFDPVLVAEKLDLEKALILEAKISNLPGVRLNINPIRQYVGGANYSHILGYTGKISPEEYEKRKSDYLLTDWTGKTGLEAQYENLLKGIHGKRLVEVDAKGQVVKNLYPSNSLNSTAGDNLVLSLDSGLEAKMAEALLESVKQNKSKGGAAIALNPQTGEILGMVSYPNFDNNIFAAGSPGAEYEKLAKDPARPLFNRAISGTYPVGSTIKPLVATAGLTEGVISSSTSIADKGVLTVKHQYDPSITFTFPDWKPGGHGSVNVIKAIAESCDIFFYAVGGGGMPGIKGLGALKLASWMNKFGLGAKTGIDLPSEAAGLVPTPEWKQKVKGEPWYVGDTYHAAIGQGDVLATPLQDLNYTATVANGGTLYKPKLLRQVLDANGNVIKDFAPEVIRANIAPKNVIDLVRTGMRQTVTAGTARSLSSLPVAVAGKTGTSQYGPQNSKTHAWFTAFAPFDNPTIALVVLVEGGGEGSSASVPVAKKILEYWFSK